jgi:type I restriction enzyme S subunit
MLSSKNIINGNVSFADARMLSRRDFAIENKRTQVSEGDVLLTIVGTIGRTAVVRDYPPLTLQRSVCVLKPNEKFLISEFLKYSLDAPQTQAYMTANGNGVAQKGIYLNQVGQIMIALPPLSEQKQIVARLESEQKLVDSNKKLIEIYQQKIKSKIAEVWGE